MEGRPANSELESAEKMEGSEDFSLLLTLSEEDPLYAKKRKLLHARGFDPEVQVFLSSSESPHMILKSLVEAARIIHLDEAELYFAGVDVFQPLDFYSPRNELESLNSVLSLIDLSLNSTMPKKMELLHQLKDATVDAIRAFGDKNREEIRIEKCNCNAEDMVLHWAKDHGLKTKLQIAHVEGAGRGAVALADLKTGDTALEVPESIIISEDLVYGSEMFDVLKGIGGISMETMLLLWSMKERHNPNSKFKIYFETLPKKFNTGLDFGVEALTALEGTLLFDEIIQAKEHLHVQYDTLCPALCRDHPDIFEPDLYTWDQFLWACELWYSNSMKVIFTDGKLRTCLVPFASFLNHSVWNVGILAVLWSVWLERNSIIFFHHEKGILEVWDSVKWRAASWIAHSPLVLIGATIRVFCYSWFVLAVVSLFVGLGSLCSFVEDCWYSLQLL